MKALLFVLIVLCQLTTVSSQNQFNKTKNAISLGVNLVNDSYTSKGFGFTGNKEYWNVSKPLYIGYTRSISPLLNLHAMITTNEYKPGKLVDGAPITDTRKYFAFDTMGQLDLSFINENWYPFDAIKPFVSFGLGYTSIDSEELPGISGRSTYNYGVGFNFWFDSFKAAQCNYLNRFSFFDNLGLTIQLIKKNSVNESKFGSQAQVTAGLIYRFK